MDTGIASFCRWEGLCSVESPGAELAPLLDCLSCPSYPKQLPPLFTSSTPGATHLVHVVYDLQHSLAHGLSATQLLELEI